MLCWDTHTMHMPPRRYTHTNIKYNCTHTDLKKYTLGHSTNISSKYMQTRTEKFSCSHEYMHIQKDGCVIKISSVKITKINKEHYKNKTKWITPLYSNIKAFSSRSSYYLWFACWFNFFCFAFQRGGKKPDKPFGIWGFSHAAYQKDLYNCKYPGKSIQYYHLQQVRCSLLSCLVASLLCLCSIFCALLSPTGSDSNNGPMHNYLQGREDRTTNTILWNQWVPLIWLWGKG